MIDLIPEEVLAASIVIGDGETKDDGVVEASVNFYLGGDRTQKLGWSKPVDVKKFSRDVPVVGFLIKRLPDIIPDEIVRIDIAIGDKNNNGELDAETNIFLYGDEDPKVHRFTELSLEEAFGLFLDVTKVVKGLL
jgi:hypothetical protein